jgi:ribosomal protein RSM22 (predicted rRNA methylase)
MDPYLVETDTALRSAIEQVLSGIPRRGLTEASRALTERYRGPRDGAQLVRSAIDSAAYAAARLPATFAAAADVCRSARDLDPDFAPTSLLDVGAGSGAASWAATAVWPGLKALTLLDSDPNMIDIGRRLHTADSRPADRSWSWEQGDVAGREFPSYDVVIASYTLGELGAEPRMAAAQAMWAATSGLLLIVEPGTPAGFKMIRTLREGLIAGGAPLLAPCPHQDACPMSGGDWCHFSSRIQRSTLHRQVKSADLSYEDEKFSYLVFTRNSVPDRVAGRVLRHPARPPKKVDLTACTRSGLRRVSVPKSHPDYRLAKKLNWGSEIPASML